MPEELPAETPSEMPSEMNDLLRQNHQLRSSLAAANTAREQLQQFIYAASHDLQEPVRAIIAYAQLLDRQFAQDPTAHEYSSFILDGAIRMRTLLQQLLTYSRAGSSKQRNVISLNVPLQMALLKLAAEIKSCSAQIVSERLPDALANEGELTQVFEHLLSNSLKFRSAATPEISITAEQGSVECTVIFRDNGPGIDPRFSEEILLPLKRLHGREVPGSGLGLAICDKIIRAHQGRLWVESDGSHGATVRFTLPL